MLDDFRVETVPAPPAAPHRLLVRNGIISFDPGIRGWLSEQASYMTPVALGDTVRGMTLGEVAASDDPAFPPGCFVRAMAGWEEWSLVPVDAIGLERLQPAPGVPLEYYMGALGPAGLTAWIGLHDVGGIRAGETVLVSAAAGAVGGVVGQLAQAAGARAIGIAGAAKLPYLPALGFAAGIDRRAPDLGAAIKATAPEGIDLYFDNVGGATLEAVLPRMRQGGRIVACGMIADYNDPEHAYGVRTLWHMVAKRLTMRGFFTYDDPALIAPAQAGLDAAFASGALVPVNDVRDGIEAAPQAFVDLMAGRTLGKTLVRLA